MLLASLLAVSLALNALLLIGAGAFVRSRGGLGFVKAKLGLARPVVVPQEVAVDADQSPHWRTKAELFAAAPARPGDVVMLGDSLTEYAPWHELLGRPDVRNMGIGGDTVDGVGRRLAAALAGPPAVLVLMIGINDLLQGAEPAAVSAAQQALIARIRAEAPGTRLVVQTLLPVHPHELGARHNPRVKAVNEALRSLEVELLDLFPLFWEGEGLASRFTYDGLHLNGAGYAVWAEALRDRL